jgi:hypothetical protein
MRASLPIVDSYLDESADEKQEHVFCIGALLAGRQDWMVIQKEWIKRLDCIDYFRTTDYKTLSGPFRRLIGECGSFSAARKKRTIFAPILKMFCSPLSAGDDLVLE